MPIDISNLQTVTNLTPSYSPKWFDSVLTGSGKKSGVLNENLNPTLPKAANARYPMSVPDRKRKISNNGVTTITIPVLPLSSGDLATLKYLPMPDPSDLYPLGVFNGASRGKAVNVRLYVSMDVHSVTIESITGGATGVTGTASRKTSVCYIPALWVLKDGEKFVHVYRNQNEMFSSKPTVFDPSYKQPDAAVVSKVLGKPLTSSPANPVSAVAHTVTFNPKEWFDAIVTILKTQKVPVNPALIDDFLNDYSVYDNCCKQSERWQTRIDKIFELSVNNMPSPNDLAYVEEAAQDIRRLEDYKIPLDLYRNIYAFIDATFDADAATHLYKQNLNLLLSNQMQLLDQCKPNLEKIPTLPAGATYAPKNFQPNAEQMAAIGTTEPLVIVQAGAGTGKSSVILERLNWLSAAGVSLNDVTVLSFTNAAADHIADEQPLVHSMTIASMIHAIYSKNFPNHMLSTIDTIVNSLDIYYPATCNDPLRETARQFKRLAMAIAISPDNRAFASMNNFVEEHQDDVLKILDRLGQTSLELEIILCYQNIETFVEPPETCTKHLIIDEVQDNSIFEFVYALKYCAKHSATLFIVGKLRLPTLNPTNCGKPVSV